MDTRHPSTRRWTVIVSGLLCALLALVVLFTKRGAFYSPLAVVVVAAIGSVAVLMQLRLRNQEQSKTLHPPVWLNLAGIILALIAFFADLLRLTPQMAQLIALAAVGSFAVSSAIILQAFRKDRAPTK